MPKKKNEIVVATTEATGTSLAALPDGDLARLKLPGDGGEIRREGAVALVEGRGYAAGGEVIPDAAVYFDADRRPAAEGVWRGEADKVAWRDAETGLECTIMRDRVDGFLGGYVGVGRDHPLYGYGVDALPNDVGIEVHGGITYARICDDGPSQNRGILQEGRSICHVSVLVSAAETTHATSHRSEPHLWWFGFTCDHAYDLKPGDRSVASLQSKRAEIGETYRDDGYVLNEVRNLARQLRAIARGEPMPPRVGSPPPIALDPRMRS